MAKNIIKPSGDFDFSSLTLNQPYAIQGGSYFTKLLNSGEQLYIQTPKCLTKSGIVKSGTKYYTDFILTQEDSCFLDWLGKLETTLHELIYDKRQLWFHNDLDMADIETAFSPPVKVIKSGTRYMVRSSIGNASGLSLNSPVRIFNENEIDLKITDVLPESPVIAILEIGGIRFSSRSFHAEINVKQMMVIQAKNSFDRCLIDLGGVSTEAHESDEDDGTQSLSDAGDIASNESLCEIVADSVEENVVDVSQAQEQQAQEKQVQEKQAQVSQVQEQQVQEKQVQEKPDQEKMTQESQAQESQAQVSQVQKKPVQEKPVQETQEQETPKNQQEKDKADRGLDSKNKIDDTNGESLEEVVLDLAQIKDSVCLKNPNEVYLELYIQAREKAKQAKKAALDAYLEAKNIKDTYLLDELDDSDEEFEMNETI